MVGPHSRGCLRCVQRKVRCDGAQPHCLKCSRIKLPCPGYARSVRFMPITTDRVTTADGCTYCALRGVVCDKKLPVCTRCMSFKLECNLTRFDRSHPTAGDFQNVDEEAGCPVSIQNRASSPPLSRIDTALTTPTSGTCCIIFLNRHFNYGPSDSDLEQIKLWIWQVFQTPSEYPVCSSAVQSTIDAFFGNIENDRERKRQALLSYSTTVRQVRSFFSTSHNTIPFDIISAVVLLRIAESCLSSNNAGWLAHTRGVKRLLELQGPSYFRVQPARSLLLWTKHALFIEAMISGRRLFLEDEEWQDILKSTNEVVSLTQRLSNISAFIPGFVEDVNYLLNDDSTELVAKQCKVQRVMKSLATLLGDLDLWWQDWLSDRFRIPQRLGSETNARDIIWSSLSAPLPPAQPNEKERTVLTFQDLETTAGFCLYHTFSIIILSLLGKVHAFMHRAPEEVLEHLADRVVIAPQISPTDGARAILSHAYAIVEALPSYTLPQYRYSGAMYMCLPVHVAWQAFTSLPYLSAEDTAQAAKMAEWLRQTLRIVAKSGGFPVVEHALQSRSGWSV